MFTVLSVTLSPYLLCLSFFFFFNDTATTEIYTLSLHDALPICRWSAARSGGSSRTSPSTTCRCARVVARRDRKSTRLNSSHGYISYAVFCLKKKKKTYYIIEDVLPHTTTRTI